MEDENKNQDVNQDQKGPELTEDQVEEITDQPVTDELQAQLDEKDDKILRLSAEIQNMHNRFGKERQDLAKYRSQSLAEKIIPSMDNLERALAIEADDEASENLKKGVEMVYKGLLEALAGEGVEVIDPKGDIFDPNFHQSVSSVPLEEGQEPEEIVEVYQKGYLLKDRILRPAMVIIAQ
ncbi:molecular chaperone GrpE [Aerococcus urinaehominis]|uniref:Protein GrpE n=1 Tax=Aerococcus urinaehominis TaxID=128944 RepID=A0A109RGH8_9LACT|nr:nucleotide exchange factor GrpE [Aerococcus urinaehominis]AMB98814.1 molecular chaperone GrpE [Aerococcus urinaehominis]SDM49232.1 molecular chaperone GrpE [Aerococcus urinaehominis]